MTKKEGLVEFQKVYDTACSLAELALDLAQNLSFDFEMGTLVKITVEDVEMAYGLTGMGKKYPLTLLEEIHKLADALGYTREDYIENADKRQGRGNVNIYIVGQGSLKL